MPIVPGARVARRRPRATVRAPAESAGCSGTAISTVWFTPRSPVRCRGLYRAEVLRAALGGRDDGDGEAVPALGPDGLDGGRGQARLGGDRLEEPAGAGHVGFVAVASVIRPSRTTLSQTMTVPGRDRRRAQPR